MTFWYIARQDSHHPWQFMLRLFLVASLLFTSCLFGPGLSSVHAQKKPDKAQEELTPRQRAQAIFAEGQQDFEQGLFVEAAARFLRAFQVDPHPIIMFNVARSYEEGGRLLKALQYFRAAQGLNPSEAVRLEIKRKISELETFLVEQGVDILNIDTATWVPKGLVSIKSDPLGAEVLISGQLVGRTPLEKLTLTQGTYTVLIKRRGFVSQEREITVVGGKSTIISPELTPGDEADPAQRIKPGTLDISAPRGGLLVVVDGEPIASTPVGSLEVSPGTHTISIEGEDFPTFEETVEVASGQTRRVVAKGPQPVVIKQTDTSLLSTRQWSLISMGGGAASIGVGALLGLLALDSADDYNTLRSDPGRPDFRSSAQALGLGADIAYGLGLGALTLGAVLYFISPEEDTEQAPEGFQKIVQSPGFWFSPQVTSDSVGVGAGGRW